MKMIDQGQVTRLLKKIQEDHDSLDGLAQLVYDDIRRVAHQQRFRAQAGETLRTTALVHEAFAKVFHASESDIQNSEHLIRIMSLTMRQLIVDHARRHLASKRGGGAVHVELEDQPVASLEPEIGCVLDMENALEKLSDFDSDLADLVCARYYGGYTTEEIAEAAGKSRRTIQRELKRANVWLRFEMGQEAAG